MDKLKEAVMKLITTDPNTPLPPTKMAILQDRLTHVFSQFRTPNHPPYAAMIQRALQELNQKGGSSEESISQFIRREYDDLPWAHSTILTHHLGLLCKSGELHMTNGLRYFFACSNSGPASMKCGRKRSKKKRRWNFERKQSKRRKTECGKLQIEDQIGVTEELRKIDEQQDQVSGNRMNGSENSQIEGIQQLNQEGALSVDVLLLSAGTENAISSELSILTVEPPQLTRDEFYAEVGVQQEECGPRNANKMIEGCDPLAEVPGEREPNQDDMLELLSTERPPGFEFVSFEKSCNNFHECTPPRHHPEKIPNLLVSVTTELCGSPISSEHHRLSQGHVLQPVMTSTTVSINKQQIEPGEHWASSKLGDNPETCGEKRPMPLESTSETGFASLENHRQVLNRDVVEPSNTENREIVNTDIVEPSTAADIIEIVGTCPLQQKKNLQNQGQNHSGEELEQRVTVLALPHQQKEHQLLETERMKGKLPLLEHSLKSQQQNKQYCRKKRLRCQRKGTSTKDVTVEIDQTTPENLLELSTIEVFQMLRPTPVVPLSSEREESCVRQKGSELLAGTTKASSKTQKDPKLLNQDFESVLSDLERVSGLESLGVHDSLETKRMQRQLRRWSGKCLDPRPTVEFRPSSELSENYKPVEMLSLDEEKPQQQKQMPSGLTQITEQRVKLRSRQKQNGAQPREKNLTNNRSFVEISPEPEPRDDLQPHLQRKLLEQGNSSQRALRPRPPRPESINSVKLDKLKPSDVPCTKQQQTDNERQGPLEANPDATGNEIVISDLTSEKLQQSVDRDRGRPPSSKPDETIVELLTSNSKFEELHRTGGRGRPPKKKYDTKISGQSACSVHQTDTNQPLRYELDKASDTDDLLTLQHQHENQQQKKHRSQGNPPKEKLGVIVVSDSTPDYQNQQEQKHTKRQVRRVPPEKDSDATPMEEGLSPSNAIPNFQKEQPKDRHHGRPPKLETGKKNLRSSKIKPRKSTRGRAQKTK